MDAFVSEILDFITLIRLEGTHHDSRRDDFTLLGRPADSALQPVAAGPVSRPEDGLSPRLKRPD